MAAAMLAILSPVASAQERSLDEKSAAATSQAFDAIQAGDPARALAMIEPVIAGFEKQYAGKRRIYCAESVNEASFYGVLPSSGGGASEQSAGDKDGSDKNGPTIIMNSGWCTAQYVRAFALIDLKRLDDAKGAFERLLQFAPRRSRYLNELGYILQQKRQWQPSIDLYVRADAAADLTPDRRDYERCVALRGIGYDLVELGKLDDAEAAYRKCLAITPNEPKSLGEIEYINQQRRKTT